MSVLHGSQLMRAVIYICMTPASWCTEKTLSQRRSAFPKQVTTTHWPHEYHAMTNYAGPGVQLSEEQRSLIAPLTRYAHKDGVKAGMPSILPARCFSVLPPGAELRRVPTEEW